MAESLDMRFSIDVECFVVSLYGVVQRAALHGIAGTDVRVALTRLLENVKWIINVLRKHRPAVDVDAEGSCVEKRLGSIENLMRLVVIVSKDDLAAADAAATVESRRQRRHKRCHNGSQSAQQPPAASSDAALAPVDTSARVSGVQLAAYEDHETNATSPGESDGGEEDGGIESEGSPAPRRSQSPVSLPKTTADDAKRDAPRQANEPLRLEDVRNLFTAIEATVKSIERCAAVGATLAAEFGTFGRMRALLLVKGSDINYEMGPFGPQIRVHFPKEKSMTLEGLGLEFWASLTTEQILMPLDRAWIRSSGQPFCSSCAVSSIFAAAQMVLSPKLSTAF
eukprot:Opistho-2@68141